MRSVLKLTEALSRAAYGALLPAEATLLVQDVPAAQRPVPGDALFCGVAVRPEP